MAFIKKKNGYEIGERVKTTIKHESMSGYFEIGTEVTVIGESERGYEIQDDEGNEMIEIGWII